VGPITGTAAPALAPAIAPVIAPDVLGSIVTELFETVSLENVDILVSLRVKLNCKEFIYA
jgi:hypothetical protein